MIEAQLEEGDPVWLKNFARNRISQVVFPTFIAYCDSVQRVEGSVPVTWPRNHDERVVSSFTMGHRS
jgi:hypothetical protein